MTDPKPRDESRHDSPQSETRKAVIFEVTHSGNAEAKIAQLELQLAVFLAKRKVKTCRVLKVTDVVACAGVCIPKVCIPEIENLLSSPICKEFLPHIFALRDAKCIEVLPSDEEMTHAPPPPPATITTTFWAQLMLPADDPTQRSKAVAFQVTPAIANIDGLKKAVKAEWDASNPKEPLNVFKLKVYAHDAAAGGWVEVMKASTLLAPNEEETAYHVLVP